MKASAYQVKTVAPYVSELQLGSGPAPAGNGYSVPTSVPMTIHQRIDDFQTKLASSAKTSNEKLARVSRW